MVVAIAEEHHGGYGLIQFLQNHTADVRKGLDRSAQLHDLAPAPEFRAQRRHIRMLDHARSVVAAIGPVIERVVDRRAIAAALEIVDAVEIDAGAEAALFMQVAAELRM